MAWKEKTLAKVSKAKRLTSDLHYNLGSVRILLYELEEYDAEHTLIVIAAEELNHLHRVLLRIERKLSSRP